MNFKTVALGEVAEFARNGVAPNHIQSGTLSVRLENIEKGGGFEGVTPVGEGECASTKFAFTPGFSTHISRLVHLGNHMGRIFKLGGF
jgi:hypothetical protein